MKGFNATISNEGSDLHHAVMKGDDAYIEQALVLKRSIAVQNDLGYSPIYYSAERNDKQLFKFLLYFHHSHDAVRMDFENAIKRQDNDLISTLSSYMSEFNIDLNGLNDVKQTLLDVALICQNEFATKLLQKHGVISTLNDLMFSDSADTLKQKIKYSYILNIKKNTHLPSIIFSQDCQKVDDNLSSITIDPWLETKNIQVYGNLSIFLRDDICYLVMRNSKNEFTMVCQLSKNGDLKLCYASLPQYKLMLSTFGECEIDGVGYVPELFVQAKAVKSSNPTKFFNGQLLTLIADDIYLEGQFVYKEFKFIVKNSYEQLGELQGDTLDLVANFVIQKGQVFLSKQFDVKAENAIDNHGQWIAVNQGVFKSHSLENNKDALIIAQKGEIQIHTHFRCTNSGAVIANAIFMESGLLLKNNIGGMVKGLTCIMQAPQYIQAGFLISGQKNSLSIIDWGINFAQAGLNISNIAGLVSASQTTMFRGYLVLAKTLYRGGELLYRYSQGETLSTSEVVTLVLDNVIPSLGFVTSQTEKAQLLVNVLYHCYGSYLSEQEFVSKSLNVIELITRMISLSTAGLLSAQNMEYLQLAQQSLQVLRFVPKAIEAVESTYDLLTSHEKSVLEKAQTTLSTIVESMMHEALYQLQPYQLFGYDLPIPDAVTFILNQGHNSDLFLQSIVFGALNVAKKSGLIQEDLQNDVEVASRLLLRTPQWIALSKRYQANQLNTTMAIHEALNTMVLIAGYGVQKYRQITVSDGTEDLAEVLEGVEPESTPLNESLDDKKIETTENEQNEKTEELEEEVEVEIEETDHILTPEEVEQQKKEAIENFTQVRPEFEHVDYRVDIEQTIEQSLANEEEPSQIDYGNALVKSLVDLQRAFGGEYAAHGYLGAFVSALHNEGIIDVSGNIGLNLQNYGTNNSSMRATGTVSVSGLDLMNRDDNSDIINPELCTTILSQFRNLEYGSVSAEEAIYFISVGLIENFGVLNAFQDIKAAANRIAKNFENGQIYSANDINLLCDFLGENAGFIQGKQVGIEGTQNSAFNSGFIIGIEKIRLTSNKKVIHEREGLLVSKRVDFESPDVKKEGAIQAGLVRARGVNSARPEILVWRKNEKDSIGGLAVEAKSSNSFDLDAFNNVQFLDVTIQDPITDTSPTLFNISSDFSHVLQLHLGESDRTIPLWQLPKISSSATLILDAPGSFLSAGALKAFYSSGLYYIGNEFSYASSAITFEKPAFFDVHTIHGEGGTSYLGLNEGGGFQAEKFINHGYILSEGTLYWNVKLLDNNAQLEKYKLFFIYSKLNPTVETAHCTKIIENSGTIISKENNGFIGVFNQTGGKFHSGEGGNFIYFDEAHQNAISTTMGKKTTPVLEDEGRNWYMMPEWHNSVISSTGDNWLIGSGKFEATGVDAWGDKSFFLYASNGISTSTKKIHYHIDATYSVHKGWHKTKEVRHPEENSSVVTKNMISSNNGEAILVSTQKDILLENTTISAAKPIVFVAQGSVKMDGVPVPYTESYTNTKKRIGKSKSVNSFTEGTKIQSSYLFSPEGVIVRSDEFKLGAVEGVIGNADIVAHRTILQGMGQNIKNKTVTKEFSIILPGQNLVDILHGHNAKAIFKTIITVCGWDQDELELLLHAKHVGEIPLHLLNVGRNAWNMSALVAHACQEYKLSPANFVGVVTDQLGLTISDGQGGHKINPNVTFKYSKMKETTEITQMIPSKLYVGGTFRFVGGSLYILDGSEISAEHLRIFLSEGIKMTKGETIIDHNVQSFSGRARVNLANLADVGVQGEIASHHEHTTLQTQASLKARDGTLEIHASYIEGEGLIEGNGGGHIVTKDLSFTSAQDTKSVKQFAAGGGISTSLAVNAHVQDQHYEEAETKQKAGIILPGGKVQADNLELNNGAKVVCQEMSRQNGEGVPTVSGTVGEDFVKERNYGAGFGYDPNGDASAQLTASFKDIVTHQNPTVLVDKEIDLGNGINRDPSQETVEVHHRENGIAIGVIIPNKDKIAKEASAINQTLTDFKAITSEFTDKVLDFSKNKSQTVLDIFKKKNEGSIEHAGITFQKPLLFRSQRSPSDRIYLDGQIFNESSELTTISKISFNTENPPAELDAASNVEPPSQKEVIEIEYDENGRVSWMREYDPSTGETNLNIVIYGDYTPPSIFSEKLYNFQEEAMRYVTAICNARQHTLDGLKHTFLHPLDTFGGIVCGVGLLIYDVSISSLYNETLLKPFVSERLHDFLHESKERNGQRLNAFGEVLSDFWEGDGPKKTEMLFGLTGDCILGGLALGVPAAVGSRLLWKFGGAIPTWRGYAYQSLSPEILAMRPQVRAGAPLYRFGNLEAGSMHVEGQFWALTSFETNPYYASLYGIPEKNILNIDFTIQGQLKPDSKFILRNSPPVGRNVGGGIELVTESGSVQLMQENLPFAKQILGEPIPEPFFNENGLPAKTLTFVKSPVGVGVIAAPVVGIENKRKYAKNI